MSGPGGPATSSAMMTPPSGMGAAQNMSRIKSNIQKMIDQSAPESDIDAYLSHEGVTVEQLKNSPVAAPFQQDQTTVSAYNPTASQRAADLMTATRSGTKAPALPEDAPVYVRALDWMKNVSDAGDTAARGLTGGLSDDAAALGDAVGASLPGSANPGDFGSTFKKADKAANANIANFKGDNPLVGNALETIGLITSPLFRAGGEWQQAAPTVSGRAFRAGAVGAGAGGVTGAAYNDGDLGDRADAALWGAGTGGTIGAALLPAIEGATATGQTFMDVLNARRQAANDPVARARQMVATAISRDNLTPIPAQGEALVSAGGPNLQSLGRQATTAPGNARAVAKDYFEGASGDMPDVVAGSAVQNVSGDRLAPTIEALDRQQRAASRPAYDAFYAISPDAFDTPYFRNLMGGQTGRTLIHDAYDLAELQRSAGDIPDNPMQYLLDAEGNPTLNQAPNARAVDMMKQAIDKQVEANTDSVTGRIKGPMGNGWERLRQSFISNADAASTVDGTSLYGTARAAYAGPAQMKDAARLGAKALSANDLTSEKAQAFNDLSPSQQGAFRTGLAEAIIDKAGKMGPNTDPVQLFLKGRNSRDLMRLYLGNQDAFDSFVRTLQQQSRIVKASRTVMGGSPTAPRLAENADAAGQEQALTDQLSMARDAWGLATGRGGGRVNAAVNIYKRGQNAATGVSEPVADELGRMLFNPSASANRSTVQSLQGPALTAQIHQAAQNILRRRLGSTISLLPAAPAGALIGSH